MANIDTLARILWDILEKQTGRVWDIETVKAMLEQALTDGGLTLRASGAEEAYRTLMATGYRMPADVD